MLETAVVYVDGACKNNGQTSAIGGCGVFWEHFHPLNESECLEGSKQSNNCAELLAAIITLTQTQKFRFTDVEIYTDSTYVKDGITKWIGQWKQNSWKTGRGSATVLNKELKMLFDKLQSNIKIYWKWVECHNNVEGNIEADSLVKAGISNNSSYW
ncbi:rnhA [Mytilus coruscus]|uniref:ribonuclease H n=1 Tax=Mytilus coruscus TaxID=42192 RepID=A0A6J8B6E0_MYTCO|nr:rnhA [Mytilus coruscus]